jgi:chemotaxis protein MotA
MKHLENIESVGRGIAVAFIATVYGVAVANLFLLPSAGKLKHRLEERLQAREMMLEGVLSIAEGLHPMLIRSKLEAYPHGQAGEAPHPERSGSRANARAGHTGVRLQRERMGSFLTSE